MLAQKTYQNQQELTSVADKIRDICLLVKLRLNLLVVFSTAFGYLLAAGISPDWASFWALTTGGFLVVGAANGLNQVIERNSDKLMDRTRHRPVAQKRMSVFEASFISAVMGLVGVSLIGILLNPLSGILAFVSLILYAFAYTPLKKVTPLAVFVGAFPGALPPLIGYTAFTGELGLMGILLFSIQFFWQFPHFWAIAWVMNDDYQKAGFRLLPLGENKNRTGAAQIVMFTIMLLPIGLLPAKFGFTGDISAIIVTIAGVIFTLQTIKLYLKLDDSSARQLMFGSFFYLPLVLITLWLDMII